MLPGVSITMRSMLISYRFNLIRSMSLSRLTLESDVYFIAISYYIRHSCARDTTHRFAQASIFRWSFISSEQNFKTRLQETRASSPSNSRFQTTFQNNSSKIQLRKRALGILDRRNIQAVIGPHLPGLSQPHQQITQRAFSEPKKGFQPGQPATNYLCNYGTKALNNVKQIARHGDPDLENLRDACIYQRPAFTLC